MAGVEAQKNLKDINDESLVVAANFAITKALVRLNVFEAEIKILNEHLRDLEKAMKVKKITNFINKQTS